MLAPDFLSLASTWDAVSAGYVTDTMEELRPYSVDAVEWLAPQEHERALDVACGPGTTTTLLAARCARVSAIDYAPNMVEQLRAQLAARSIDNVDAHVMDGQALDFESDSFDLATSMFGLMFFPDVAKGLSELHRVLAPGGRVAVGAWAPATEAAAMATLFGAMWVVAPELPRPDEPPKLSELQDPERFRAKLEAAGFEDVAIHTLEHGFSYEDPVNGWASIERGSAPFVMLRQALGEEVWESRREAAIAYLKESFEAWPVSIGSRAWLATGRKPGA